MIPNPIKLTRIVRKMMRSGRVTTVAAILHSRARYTLSVLLETISARTVARRAGLAAALTLAVAAARPAAQPPAGVATLRPEILGTRGIVAAGRHYSVSAGVRMLQQ